MKENKDLFRFFAFFQKELKGDYFEKEQSHHYNGFIVIISDCRPFSLTLVAFKRKIKYPCSFQ